MTIYSSAAVNTTALIVSICMGMILLLLGGRILGGPLGPNVARRLPYAVLAFVAGLGLLVAPFVPDLLHPRQRDTAAELAAMEAALHAALTESQGLGTKLAALETEHGKLGQDKRRLEDAHTSQLATIRRALIDAKRDLAMRTGVGLDTAHAGLTTASIRSSEDMHEQILREIATLPEYGHDPKIAMLDAERARLIGENRELRDKHDTHLTSILLTARDARRLFAAKAGGHPVPGAAIPDHGPVPSNARHTIAQKYELVVTELDGLRRSLSDPALHCGPRNEPAQELTRLRDRMGAQLRTESYDVSVYPDNELIRGKKGRYYTIDLKDAASGVRFFFEGGKYTIASRQEQFRSSMNKFVQDILEKVHGKVDYQLMVRGSADSASWRGKLEPGHEYRSISYMRTLGNDKYVNEFANLRLDGSIQNADLPNLRAAFLQRLVASVYPVNEPLILDGSVTSKVAQSDRNAELILFVSW